MTDILQMRDDYKTLRRWWKDVDCWSNDDLAEADSVFITEMNGGGEDAERCAAYLALRAEDIRRERAMMAERVRTMEARIREAARLFKAGKEAA